MILYVNGDSHAAAAECVNAHAWAQDDGLYYGLGKQPHPENERASFGCELANWLNAILYLDAQAGGSNARIIRTTKDWLQHQTNTKDLFVVLQWSTWEREEWWHEGHDFQVNASGIDDVPGELQDRYKQFVVNVDWEACRQRAHKEIWEFHNELKDAGIRHVMFNGNTHFEGVSTQYNWGTNYIGPYDHTKTYDFVLKNSGFKTVAPESWHFGAEAHCFWGEYLLHYIKNNNLLDPNEISAY